MKKNLIKLFSIITLVLIGLVLVGCGETKTTDDDKKEEEIDWSSKTISTVTFDEASFAASYDVDDFYIGLLKLHITYTDGTERDIPCTKDMLEDSDYKKLSSAGTKKVTFTYEDFCEETKVNIIDYAVADMNLNRNNLYNCVFKIIRNQETNKLDFIVDPKLGFAGIQAKFTFEKGKIELSNFVINEATNGYGNFVFDKDNATLTITFVTDNNIETETTLFSCDWTGDFRFSGLKADDTFANKMYSLREELDDYTTVEMASILLHVSQK